MHPQYLVDENQRRTAVVLSVSERERALAELGALDDIRAYDQANSPPQKAIPFEQAAGETQGRQET